MARDLTFRVSATNSKFRSVMQQTSSDIKRFDSNVKQSAQVVGGWSKALLAVPQALGATGAALSVTSDKLNRTSQTFQRTSRNMLLGVTALTAGLYKLTQAASDEEETMQKFGETFKENAKDMSAWADATSKAYQRSRVEFHKFMADSNAVIAPIMKNAEKANEMSQEVTKLAYDLASFHNISDDEAFNKIISGLTGQTEPMRRLGVILTDAALQEFALAEGIAKRTSEMTEAEKVELRYRLMLERTTNAQTDAVRTQRSWSNQMKAFSSNLEEGAIEVGKYYRVLMTMALPSVNKMMVAGIEWIRNNKQTAATIALVTAGVIGAVGALALLLAGVSLVTKGLGLFTGVLSILFGPIGALILFSGLLYTAWTNDWGGIQGKTEAVITAVQNAITSFNNWWENSETAAVFKKAWEELVGIWTDDTKTLGEKLGASLEVGSDVVIQLGKIVWDWAGRKYDSLKDWWNGYTETVINEETGIAEEREIEGFKHKVKNFITSAWEWAGQKYDSLKDWWNGYVVTTRDEEAGLTTVRFVPGFKHKIANTIESWWEWAGQKYDSLKDWWNGYSEEVLDEESGLMETREVEGFKYKIQQTIQAGWEWVEDKLPPEWIERAMVAGEFVQVQIKAGFELAGEIYEAYKTGAESGDWAPFWALVSSTWSDGVLLGVTLSSVIKGVAAVQAAIKTGLGLIAATGVPGALGAISVAIKLIESRTAGEGYEDFGANLAAGIIAGLLVGGLLASPSAGALAFTVVFNAEIGEDSWEGVQIFFDWLAHNIQNLFNLQWDELMSLGDFMRMRAREQLGAEYEIEELDPELEKQRYQWRLYSAAGRLASGESSEEDLLQEANTLALDEGDLRKAHSILLAIGELSEALGVTVDSLMGMEPSELAKFIMSQQHELTAGIAERHNITSRDLFNYLSNPPPTDLPVPELEGAAEELEVAAEAIEVSAQELQEAAKTFKAPQPHHYKNIESTKAFLDSGGSEAIDYIAKELGIKPEWVLAQFALESEYFRSDLAKSFNFGGVKRFGEGASVIGGDGEKYRAYESPMEFAIDFVAMIKSAFPQAEGAGSLQEWLYALQHTGEHGVYAEDEEYETKVPGTLVNIEKYLAFIGLEEMGEEHGYDYAANFAQGVADGSVELEREVAQRFLDLIKRWVHDVAENDATAQRWGWDFVKHFVLGVQKGSADAQEDIQEVADEVLMPLTFDNPENDEWARDSGKDFLQYLGAGMLDGAAGVLGIVKSIFTRIFDTAIKVVEQRYPEAIGWVRDLRDELIAGLSELEDYFSEGGEEGGQPSKKLRELDEQTKAWLGTLASGMADAIAYGRSLTDVFDNFIRMIASHAMKQAFTDLLLKLGTAVINMSNPFASATTIAVGGTGGGAGGGMIADLLTPYHTGGIVGAGDMGSDEVPILAQTGERVLSRKQNDYFEKLLEEPRNVEIHINAVDAKSFVDMLATNPDPIVQIVAGDFVNNGLMRKVLRSG